MIPDAKALTIVKIFPSGWRMGTYRLKRGAETPIMLVKRMATMDMIFRGKALALLTHGFVDSASHSSGAVDVAGDTMKLTRIRAKKKSFMSVVVEAAIIIFLNFFFLYKYNVLLFCICVGSILACYDLCLYREYRRAISMPNFW